MTEDLPTERPHDRVPGERLVVGSTALKGLAHPLRVRLLTELSDRGRATATQLAEALGESSGATSYHLRQLHRHGFVVPDPTAGTGRERYWRVAPGGWDLPVFDLVDDAAGSAAVDLVLQQQLQQDAQRAIQVLHQAPAWPQQWRETVRRMETTLSLTAEQVAALHEEVDAVFDRYRTTPAQPGSRRVVFQLNSTPTEHPGVGADERSGDAAAEPGKAQR